MLEAVLNTLLSFWLFDVWFYCQWWAYAFIFPVIFYTIFFFIKWAILTAPLWLPFHIIVNSITVNSIKRNRNK